MWLIGREMRRRRKNRKRYDPKAYVIELLPEQFFIVSKEALNIRIGRISVSYELINILKVSIRDL
jgi:hypothetical protein